MCPTMQSAGISRENQLQHTLQQHATKRRWIWFPPIVRQAQILKIRRCYTVAVVLANVLIPLCVPQPYCKINLINSFTLLTTTKSNIHRFYEVGGSDESRCKWLSMMHCCVGFQRIQFQRSSWITAVTFHLNTNVCLYRPIANWCYVWMADCLECGQVRFSSAQILIFIASFRKTEDMSIQIAALY